MFGSLKNQKHIYERQESIDLLRIIACLMVIFNHTNERGFRRYLVNDPTSISFKLHLLCSIMCKSAVPIFFMVSGAMLLRKKESIIDSWRRIPKILVDVILFSIIYFWVDAIRAENHFSLFEVLRILLKNSYWHLWYLYAYISFIITLPFVRKLVQGLDIKSSVYMYTVAVFTMGIFPIIEYFGNEVNGYLKPLWIIDSILIYPVMGYVANELIDILNIKRIHITLIWIVNILSITIGEICEYYRVLREPDNNSEIFLKNFCIINAAVIFLTVKYIFAKNVFSKRISNVIVEIGQCTFGIYLLHILILWKIPVFYNMWMKIEQNLCMGKFYGAFISCALTFVIAGIATYIMRRLPVVRKLF